MPSPKRFSWAEWENTKQRSRILFTSSMYNSIFLIFPYLGKVKSRSNWTEELGVCVVCCLVLKAGSAQTTLQAQSVRPHRLIHSSISRCWSVFHIWMNGIRTAWGHAPPWKFFGSSLTKIADDDVSPYHFENTLQVWHYLHMFLGFLAYGTANSTRINKNATTWTMQAVFVDRSGRSGQTEARLILAAWIGRIH